MNLTQEQQTIIEQATGPVSRIIAYAGTGKTHTLQAYAERHIKHTLYLAFNTSVKSEATKRFPKSHVQCLTIHSLAYRAMRPKGEVKSYMSFFEVRKFLECTLERAVNVVDTVEEYMRSAVREITPDICPFRYDSPDDLEIRTEVAKDAKCLYQAMRAGKFPITHGFYLKEYQLTNPIIRADTILLDEAQDTNPVMLDILTRQRCRMICVGDPYQQIYGFTGAVDAMESLKGKDFYLTQSFRFGQTLADMASMFLGMFYELPKPLLGLPSVQTDVVDDMAMPFTHIFRTNSGLFDAAVDYTNIGRKIALTGGGGRVQDFLEELNKLWFVFAGQPERCTNPLYTAFNGWNGLRAWTTAREDTVLANKMDIVEKYGMSLPDVIARVRRNVVSDEQAQVLLVTAHRSKGMQWDRVRLADDFMLLTDEHGEPLKLSKQRVKGDAIFEEIDSNEAHLVYVAMTRAVRQVRLCKTFTDLVQGKPNEVLRRIREARAVKAMLANDENVQAALAKYDDREDEDYE